MSKSVTFPFSMDCTKDQLRSVMAGLQCVGYDMGIYEFSGKYFVNNFAYLKMATLVDDEELCTSNGRTYLGEFNKGLLLGLCAIDSSNDIGKYFKYIGKTTRYYTENNLYECLSNYHLNNESFIDDTGFYSCNDNLNNLLFMQATPQEIINHFKQEDMSKKVTSKEFDFDTDLKPGVLIELETGEMLTIIDDGEDKMIAEVDNLCAIEGSEIKSQIEDEYESNILAVTYGADTLWSKPYEVIELTIEEIAKLKGCKPEQIRIKE